MTATRDGDPGRRAFLRTTGATLGFSWLAANLPQLAAAAEAADQVRAAGTGFANLAEAEAADLAAIAARIIPSDDSPGATEAGVIWFIDQAFGRFAAAKASGLRQGLAELNGAVRAATGKARFAQLAPGQQDTLLATRDTTPFFEELRFLTLAGLLTLPSYGGNRDHLGWKLIGFEHRHAWMPPFGYYDAEAMNGGGARG